MQLPGMSYDPVRLSLDLTWWPDAGTFGVSRRLWTQPHRGSQWVLEDLATSGTPILLVELEDRWSDAAALSFQYFTDLMRSQREPF